MNVDVLIGFHLLLILAFSSSVRCSVLVLMTTLTLFTLKTCEDTRAIVSTARAHTAGDWNTEELV